MKKILFKISAIVSGFSFLFVSFFFAVPAFAQTPNIQLSIISNIYYAKENISIDVTDTATNLTVNDILKINQNDGQNYTIQANWSNSFNGEQYLQLVFQPALPANAQLLAVSLEHIFSKNPVNDSNLMLANYEIDKDYVLGNWLADWQSSNFDISLVPAATNINQSIDLLAIFPNLTIEDINSLAVRFRAQKEASGAIAKTDHDLFVLKIDYKLLPLAPELYTPRNFAFINSETSNALRPQFSWQNIDPNYYYKIQLNRTELNEPYICDFSTPYLEEIVGGNAQYQPATDLAEGHYCWRVLVSDDGGVSFPVASEEYNFTLDITKPLPLQKVDILPISPSKDNSPQITGKFNPLDQDAVEANILFYDELKGSGYFYEIARTGNYFDQAIIYFLDKINPLNIKSSDFKTTKQVTHLRDGIYKIYGFAKDEAGNISTPLILASPYIIDTVAPEAPVVATSFDGKSVTVYWNKIEDAVLYEVYRDGDLVATTTNTQIVETGLIKGKTYSYWVIALDEAGNRSLASNKTSVYILNPRVSSVSLTESAQISPQVQASPENLSTPQGTVEAETAPEIAKTTNWALIVAVILGALLILGGGLYWWYTKTEEEI